MRRIALRIAYDGGGYAGWQSQENAPAVQDAVEDAIRRAFGESPRLYGAGRTDAGVHATGQVASFDLRHSIAVDRIPAAIEMHLPSAIRIREAAPAAHDFDPRRDAVARRYRYRLAAGPPAPVLERTYVTHHPYLLDADRLEAATRAWVGARDLSAFVPEKFREEARTRDLPRIEFSRVAGVERERYEWVLEAEAFLQHQVRTMVGTLLEISRRTASPAGATSEARRILDARDRRAAASPAPPEGLVLEEVSYPPDRDPFRRDAA